MSRPSEQEISEALTLLDALIEETLAVYRSAARPERDPLKVLRAAVEARPVWPSKEASEYLGVQTAHLPKLRGLPAPAQVLDRPSTTHPEKKAFLYYVDEIKAFGVSSGRVKEGGS